MALSHRKVHRAVGHAQVRQRRAFTRPASTCRSGPHGHRLNTSGRLCGPIRLQSIRFHVLLNSLFKVLFNFPHGTCSLSVSCSYLALDGVYHPLWTALPSNPTPGTRTRSGDHCDTWAYHPLRVSPVRENLVASHSPQDTVPHTTGPVDRSGPGDSVLGSSLFTRRY